MVTRGFVVFFSVITTNVFLTGLQFLSNPAAGSINTVEVICVVIASFLAGMFGFLAAMGQSRALALVHFIFVAILLGIQLGFGIYALVLAGDVLTPFEIFMTVLQFLITLAGCVAAGFITLWLPRPLVRRLAALRCSAMSTRACNWELNRKIEIE